MPPSLSRIPRRVVFAALFSLVSAVLAWPHGARAQAWPAVIRIGSPDLGTNGKSSSGPGILSIVQRRQWLEQAFAKDGVKIEWHFFRGAGPAVHEALSAGQLDIVSLGDLAAVIGKSRGLPTRFIYAAGRCANSYLATAPGSDIRTVADLRGKKVSVLKGTAYQRPFDHLLASAGLTEKDLKLINLDWPASKSAVVAREIDATFGGADLVQLKDKGVNIPVSTKGHGAGFTIDSGVLATDDFIARYPQAVARVVAQLVRAAHWASQDANREAFIQLAVEGSGQTEAVIRSEFEGENLAVCFSPLIDEDFIADYQGVLDEALKLGLVRQGFDVRAWFQPTFTQQALKELLLEKFWTARDASGKPVK